MARSDRPLDNPMNWSFHLGRLFDINIRVHIAFVICAVVLVSMEVRSRGSGSDWTLLELLTDALGTYAILFFIVLVHEFGHCFGARYTGGEADEILIWPLGGLAMTNPPHNAKAHMITTVAGPMVNVILCCLAALILIVWTGRVAAIPFNPIHPFAPFDRTLYLTLTNAQFWVIRFFGVSYLLLVFNLLPIFPFDGGRVVQAWLWPKKGYHRSMEIATLTGMIGAIAVGMFGLFIEESLLLLMIAAFGYLTCWQQRRMLREMPEMAGELGYDFSRGYAAFDDPEDKPRQPGYFERRRKRKAAQRAEQENLRRELGEQRLERILKKISHSGMESLTAQEREVLERESQRKRSEL